MSLSDEEFREEYKPLHVPGHFDVADTQQNKMVFALAHIGEGTADEVIAELEKLESSPMNEQNRAFISTTLESLYKHGHLTGHLTGSEQGGQMHYNLNKITRANDGATDPDLEWINHHSGHSARDKPYSNNPGPPKIHAYQRSKILCA
jgi:hypothetical protein